MYVNRTRMERVEHWAWRADLQTQPYDFAYGPYLDLWAEHALSRSLSVQEIGPHLDIEFGNVLGKQTKSRPMRKDARGLNLMIFFSLNPHIYIYSKIWWMNLFLRMLVWELEAKGLYILVFISWFSRQMLGMSVNLGFTFFFFFF